MRAKTHKTRFMSALPIAVPLWRYSEEGRSASRSLSSTWFPACQCSTRETFYIKTWMAFYGPSAELRSCDSFALLTRRLVENFAVYEAFGKADRRADSCPPEELTREAMKMSNECLGELLHLRLLLSMWFSVVVGSVPLSLGWQIAQIRAQGRGMPSPWTWGEHNT